MGHTLVMSNIMYTQNATLYTKQFSHVYEVPGNVHYSQIQDDSMEWNNAPGSNHFEVVIYIVMVIAPVCLMV